MSQLCYLQSCSIGFEQWHLVGVNFWKVPN